jgi:hypothetical protein
MPQSLQAGIATPREPSPRVRINAHSPPALSVIIADLHARQRTGVAVLQSDAKERRRMDVSCTSRIR